MRWRDYFYGWQVKLGRYPSLYYLLFAHRFPYNHMRVTPNTELCIEGFPRSANSYAVVAFKLVNPKVKVAHHLHVPAQVLKSVELHIPTVLLIRAPEDAVTSFLIFQRSREVDYYLNLYRKFYETLLPVVDRVLVIDFRLVVGDVNQMIAGINTRFHRDYALIEPLDDRKADILSRLEKYNRQFFGGKVHRSVLPSGERDLWKAELKVRVEQSPAFSAARNVYSHFYREALKWE